MNSVKPITGRQAGELCRLLQERGVSGEEFQYILEAPDKMVVFIRNEAAIRTGVYAVTVDYGLSLQEMIDAGRYDWVNENITQKNFPVKGKGKVTVNVELIHFNRFIESEEVLKEFDQRGLRTATLPELLGFGASYPELQRQFPIVELDSDWQDRDGDRYVGVLSEDDDGRYLDLYWFEDEWFGHCRFLAVRK